MIIKSSGKQTVKPLFSEKSQNVHHYKGWGMKYYPKKKKWLKL